MAHALATTEGKTAMMYAGETPWHGLGTRLEEPATSREAMVAVGLDDNVDLKPIYTGDGTLIPQRKAVVRDDSREVLEVVGNSSENSGISPPPRIRSRRYC